MRAEDAMSTKEGGVDGGAGEVIDLDAMEGGEEIVRRLMDGDDSALAALTPEGKARDDANARVSPLNHGVPVSHRELEEGGFTTKSAKIRELHRLGVANNVIAKFMGVRYQHVRNVVTTPLKRKKGDTYKPTELQARHPDWVDGDDE